jgi:hypothetical protein
METISIKFLGIGKKSAFNVGNRELQKAFKWKERNPIKIAV